MNKLFFLASLLSQSFFYANECHMCQMPKETQPILQASYFEVADAKLYCQTDGEGPLLLVVHGGPGFSQEYLLPAMEQLCKENKVVFYDQRGCGLSKSEINIANINIARFIEDIEALRVFHREEKINILGHSWGAHLALHYAIAYPENVNKLLLVGSIPCNSHGYNLFRKEWSKRMAPYLGEIEKIQASKSFEEGDPITISNYFTIMFQAYCYNPQDAKKLNLIKPAEANIRGNKVYQLFQENYYSKPFDLGPSMKKLTCKTLVLHGQEDIIPIETALVIHDQLKQSQFSVIEKCGHFPYVEKPQEFFAKIQEFLKE